MDIIQEYLDFTNTHTELFDNDAEKELFLFKLVSKTDELKNEINSASHIEQNSLFLVMYTDTSFSNKDILDNINKFNLLCDYDCNNDLINRTITTLEEENLHIHDTKRIIDIVNFYNCHFTLHTIRKPIIK